MLAAGCARARSEDAGHSLYNINVGRLLAGTVPAGARTRKDPPTNMKLLCIFAGLLAVTLARQLETNKEAIEDLEAAASLEILKTDQETLESSASTYNNNYIPPSQRPPRPWNPPQNNYIPQNTWTPPLSTLAPPQNNYVPPLNNYIPPQNNYFPPQNNHVPPQNDYVPPQNNYVPPTNNYVPPQNNYVPPQNNYVPPQNNYVPPQNNYVPPQNDYVQHNTWTTTTPSSVIKNEQTFGENGSYKYEYQIADGTHVGEEGYVVNPNTDHESLVKKGWYSYPGADGKVYTVTYWADETGYHAFGDHLPTPPPVPPAIQAAIDQAAKEEAAQAEAEKNKPQQGYYPPTPQQPQQTYYPQNQQTYYPQQQQTYPQQQQTYPQNQQTYPQNQQTYYPPSSYGK